MKKNLIVFAIFALFTCALVNCDDDQDEPKTDYTEADIKYGERVGTVSAQRGRVHFNTVYKRWYIDTFIDTEEVTKEIKYYPTNLPQDKKVENLDISSFNGETYKLVKPQIENKENIEHYAIILTEN